MPIDEKDELQIDKIKNNNKLEYTSKTSILLDRKENRLKRISAVIQDEKLAAPAPTVDVNVDIPQESRVGKKLSDLTTKRVIVLVLSMVICLGLFEVEFWRPVDQDYL